MISYLRMNLLIMENTRELSQRSTSNRARGIENCAEPVGERKVNLLNIDEGTFYIYFMQISSP